MSAKSIRCWKPCRPQGLPLLIHGEVTDPDVDIFRPRSGVHRPGLEPDRSRLSRAENRAGARITTQDAADYVGCAGHGRGDHHHITCSTIAMPSSRGRHPTALLLSASAQARAPPTSADQNRHQRRSQILPRHRQRPSPTFGQGNRLRLRWLPHRPRRAGAVRRSLRLGRRTG